MGVRGSRARLWSGLTLVLCTSSCGVLVMSIDDLTAGDGGGSGADGSSNTPDSSPPNGDDGGGSADASDEDAGEPVDAKSLCPINPCPGPNVCCYTKKTATSGVFSCMPSCNGSDPVDCIIPEQCDASTPLCCGQAKFGPGTAPACPLDGLASSCRASCDGNVALSCNVTNQVRLCHVAADCASDPQHKNCCVYNNAGVASPHMCLADIIKMYAPVTCVP